MHKAYRDDLKCPHCGFNWLPKAGIPRGKQTYRCGDWLNRFTPAASRSYCSEAIKRQAIAMYAEVLGYAAISRVLGGKPEPIYSWVSPSGNDYAGGEACAMAATAGGG